MKYWIIPIVLFLMMMISLVSCTRNHVTYTIGGKPIPEASVPLGNPDTMEHVIREFGRLGKNRTQAYDSALYYKDIQPPNDAKLRFHIERFQYWADKCDSLVEKYDLEELIKLTKDSLNTHKKQLI